MNSTERKAHNSEMFVKSEENEAPDFEDENQCVPDTDAANIITKVAKKSRKKVFTNDLGSSKKLRTGPGPGPTETTIDQSQLLTKLQQENLDLFERSAVLQEKNRDLIDQLEKLETLNHKVQKHQVFTNEKGEHYFKLSFKRRATINKFQGATLLNLRLYCPDDNGNLTIPTKKGIALPPEQFKVLIDICKNGQLQNEIDRIEQH